MPAPHQRRDSDRYCQLCAAWFNNPVMAQQHYDGKKHKKNAARADLLEQLGKTLDLGELRGESAGTRRARTPLPWDPVAAAPPSPFLWSGGAGETLVLLLLYEAPAAVEEPPHSETTAFSLAASFTSCFLGISFASSQNSPVH